MILSVIRRTISAILFGLTVSVVVWVAVKLSITPGDIVNTIELGFESYPVYFPIAIVVAVFTFLLFNKIGKSFLYFSIFLFVMVLVGWYGIQLPIVSDWLLPMLKGS
ncbi:MAG: hypothetical protein KAR42_07020 [candidate division Zixibacteria bacterium]|nr:hypothetical protein [candidate division Zixibacteria bacterium]